jgi:hypothetical protein
MKTAELRSSESRHRLRSPAAVAFGLVIVLLWVSCGGAPQMHY